MPVTIWTAAREELMLTMLADGAKQSEIARLFGTHTSTIEKRIQKMRKTGLTVQTQRTGPRGGAGHPEWKGGRVLDKDGYLMVWMPDHPMARGKYVLEHRLVMAQHLGRMLTPQEVVHHISKDKLDNRIENLQLFEKNPDHLKHELKGKCPQWTEGGKARIQAALALARQINLGQVESGARLKPKSENHPTE